MRRWFALWLLLALGCSSDTEVDDNEPISCGARARPFWSTLAMEAEWVEYHGTLREMRESADLAILGRFEEVRLGKKFHDGRLLYVEGVFEITPTEDGFNERSEPPLMTLVLPNVVSEEQVAPAVELLRKCMPTDEVLFFLRRGDSGQFTVVNGYGIWARTDRATIDCPLERDDSSKDSIYAQEISEYSTVRSMAEDLLQ